MGRKKMLLEDHIIYVERKLKEGHSLRSLGRELGVSHEALRKRLKKRNMDKNIKQKTKIATKKKDTNNKRIDQYKDHKEMVKKKSNKDEFYLSSDALRGLFHLFYGKSDGHKNSRIQLLDIFITEFQRQKGMMK